MQKLIEITGLDADGFDVYTMVVSALPECVMQFIEYERKCAVLAGAVRVVIDISESAPCLKDGTNSLPPPIRTKSFSNSPSA